MSFMRAMASTAVLFYTLQIIAVHAQPFFTSLSLNATCCAATTFAATSPTAIESHYYRISAAGVAPRPRSGAAVALDSVNKRFVVIGGSMGGVGNELSDMWYDRGIRDRRYLLVSSHE